MRLLLFLTILALFQCGGKNVDKINSSNNSVTANLSKTTSNTQNADDKSMTNPIPSDIEFKATVNSTTDYVEVTYTVTNKGDKSYLIFNRGDTNKGLDKGRLYVEPSANGIIELSQKRFSKPENKSCPNFEVPVEAGASWLKPKQTITETVRTSLPLRFYTPFDSCTPQSEMPKEIKTVKFCLGIAEADSAKVKVNENGYIENWQDVGMQKLLCTQETTL